MKADGVHADYVCYLTLVEGAMELWWKQGGTSDDPLLPTIHEYFQQALGAAPSNVPLWRARHREVALDKRCA